MSTSQHPVALRLEQHVGRGTKLLAMVMALPLVDGIFPALVLAGALGSTFGIIEVGILVFGGSATLAVVLAEMDGSRSEQVRSILLVGTVLAIGAGLEAAFAPAFDAVLDLEIFKRFAALVIISIAAKTASATVGEYLPGPAAIVVFGLLASAHPAGLQGLVLEPNLANAARGVAAAGAGISFALGAALFGPTLRRYVDLDRFRFGSAIALGVLALTIVGPPIGFQTDAPIALAVLAVTSLLALDPEGNADAQNARGPTDPADVVAEAAADAAGAAQSAAATDGGESVEQSRDPEAERERDPEAERAPWL